MATEVEIKTEILAAINADIIKNSRALERVNIEVDEFASREGLDGKSILQKFYSQWKSGNKGNENKLNCMTAYLLGMTTQEPQGDFTFVKRRAFARPSPPDIDSDFDYERRQEVMDYIVGKYGRYSVGNIGTYGALKMRSALTRIIKALDIANAWVDGEKNEDYTPRNLEKVDEILGSLPPQRGAVLKVNDDDGEHIIKTSEDAVQYCRDFKFYMDKYPDIMKNAKNIEGLLSIFSVHASGVVLSDIPLDQIAPLRTAKDTGGTVAFATQFAYEDLETLGLIKFDILAISTLTVIAETVKLIEQNTGTLLDIENLPIDAKTSIEAKKTYDLYKTGDLIGVFQCESRGMQETCRDVSVDRFEDIMAVISLYRPGPMDSIPEYVERKKGLKQVTYFHPSMEPFLKSVLGTNYGILVYQEDVMHICAVFGMTVTEALIVIKGIGKKKDDIIAKGRNAFITGAIGKGIKKEIAEGFWDKFITPFAAYGFNKSVSQNTFIQTPFGNKQIKDFKQGDKVYSVDQMGKIVLSNVINLHDHGVLDGFEVFFDDESSVICSFNHKFLTEYGQQPLWKICKDRLSIYGTQLEGADYETNTMDSKVRENRIWAKSFEKASTSMQTMQRICLEEKVRHVSCSSGEMRDSMSNLEIAAKSPKMLQEVQRYKSGEYSITDGKIEYGQSFATEKSNTFRNGESNICSTRNTKSQSGTFEEMERRESGKIRCLHFGGTKKSQTFQNGVLVKELFGVGNAESSVWRETQTSGFSERSNMDRGGRILPFLRNKKSETSIEESAGTGCDVEYRSNEPSRYNAFENKYGVFSSFWRDKERMAINNEQYASISDTRHLVPRKIIRVVPVGKQRMYDLEVACSTHNFLLANNIVTSNSHSCCYAYNSYITAFLKANYPEEFICAYLNVETTRRKLDRVIELEREAMNKMGIKILPRDINKCGLNYDIVKKKDSKSGIMHSEIRPAIHCKGLPTAAAENIVANAPYSGTNWKEAIRDFAQKTDPSVVDVESIVALSDAGFFKTKKDKLVEEFTILREDLKKLRKAGKVSMDLFE